MPTYANKHKLGIEHNAGRKPGGHGVTTPGLKGQGDIVTPIGSQQGGEGRDERHASIPADLGNELVGAPRAKERSYP
jgi:hypothetical protein